MLKDFHEGLRLLPYHTIIRRDACYAVTCRNRKPGSPLRSVRLRSKAHRVANAPPREWPVTVISRDAPGYLRLQFTVTISGARRLIVLQDRPSTSHLPSPRRTCRGVAARCTAHSASPWHTNRRSPRARNTRAHGRGPSPRHTGVDGDGGVVGGW